MLSTTIRLAGRRVHLVRQARDCQHCSNHEAHARLEARPFLQGEITRAAYRDASALSDFRALAATYGLLHDVHRVVNSEVLEHVAWLLQTGRLIAIECRIPVHETPMAPRPAAPPPRRSQPRLVIADPPIKTWVEIELLDEEGKPVANERYVVTVPEGVTNYGNLDDKGRARITNIDPGMCDISFPDIDRREWKAM